MVVLDHVDSALGHAPRELGETRRRETLRLERRAGHGAPFRSAAPSEPVHALPRPAEGRRQFRRELGIFEHDVVLDGTVAEQHVHELPGFETGGRGGKPDAHAERAVARILDRLDAPHDIRAHLGVVDRVERQFHALLERQRPGARLDGAGVRADAVMRDKPRHRRSVLGNLIVRYFTRFPARRINEFVAYAG